MNSTDHDDLRIDACQIMQAGNNGYIVLPLHGGGGTMIVPHAAFTTKDELAKWLIDHLY